MASKRTRGCSIPWILSVAMLLLSKGIEAKDLVVGNQMGWTNYDLSNFEVPNYGAWAISQRAVVGDSVVFKYAKGLHNVNLLPNRDAYLSCDFSRARQLDNGASGMYIWQATSPGVYYFGCNKEVEAEGNHCGSGQKLALMVRAAQTSDEMDGVNAELAILAVATPGEAPAPTPATPGAAPVPGAAITTPMASPVPGAAPPTAAVSPATPPQVPPAPATSPVSVAPATSPPAVAPVSSPAASVPSILPASTPSVSAPASSPSSPPSTLLSPAPTTTSPPPPSTSPTPIATPPSPSPQTSPSSAAGLSPVASLASPPAPPLSAGATTGAPTPSTSGSSDSGRNLIAAILWDYLIAIAVMALMLP